MTTLTTKMSLELAWLAYDIRFPSGLTGEYEIVARPAIRPFFSFDLSNGPIKATTGGAALFRCFNFLNLVGHRE